MENKMPLGKDAWKHDPQIMKMELRRQEIEAMPDGTEKDECKREWDLTLQINLWGCMIAAFIVVAGFLGLIVVAILDCTGAINIIGGQ
jgi:hypothetical protein